jgi:hypothetical protein
MVDIFPYHKELALEARLVQNITCLKEYMSGLNFNAIYFYLFSGNASSPGPSPLPGRKLHTIVASSVAQLAPRPGAIDNSCLVLSPGPAGIKVPSLTAEGGRLRRAVVLTQGRDFQLVPQALWRALLQWYGGSPPLPRQVSCEL